MRDLIILSSGVHGEEMAEIVERINRVEPTWNLRGFVAASEKDARRERNGYPVLGTISALADHPGAACVPDNEWPVDSGVPRDGFASIIDPGAFVSRTARIGAGCVIYPNCYVGLNARLGDFVFSLSGSVINHDCVVGDRAVLATGVHLAGYVKVEDGCYLGQSSTVRQFLTIGRGSMLGMGAVVVKDVAAGSVMAGNPARKLRDQRGG